MKHAQEFKISNLEFEGCCYMTFRMERGSDIELVRRLERLARTEGIDCESLVSNNETPIFDKYDDYIPAELLRRAYAADKLRADEAEERLIELRAELED